MCVCVLSLFLGSLITFTGAYIQSGIYSLGIFGNFEKWIHTVRSDVVLYCHIKSVFIAYFSMGFMLIACKHVVISIWRLVWESASMAPPPPNSPTEEPWSSSLKSQGELNAPRLDVAFVDEQKLHSSPSVVFFVLILLSLSCPLPLTLTVSQRSWAHLRSICSAKAHTDWYSISFIFYFSCVWVCVLFKF